MTWLAHETLGDGEPLVLMHGLATTRAIWRRVLPLLARGRRLVALDVPGFGETPAAGPGFELDAVADDILEGLESIAPAPFDLVGHSLGGALAIALADRHPRAIRRLVLVAPAGLRPFPARAARVVGAAARHAIPLRRRGAALADTAWGRRILMTPSTADPTSLPPAEVRAMLDASRGATRIAEAFESAASADLRERLQRLEVPVGALWGADDRIIPPSGTFERARPDAPTATIAGTGHIPMIEQPERFAAALEDLLERLSPPGNIALRGQN